MEPGGRDPLVTLDDRAALVVASEVLEVRRCQTPENYCIAKHWARAQLRLRAVGNVFRLPSIEGA